MEELSNLPTTDVNLSRVPTTAITLKQYRAQGGKVVKAATKTVASVPGDTESADRLGNRIPVVDRGDPRDLTNRSREGRTRHYDENQSIPKYVIW